MMLQKTVDLPATLKAASEFSQELETLFEPLPLSVRVGVILAIHELCVNIVEHAYASVDGRIQIQVDWTSERLKLLFTDQAPIGFNYQANAAAPNPLDLQEHGMGLFLIQQAFDTVEYRHFSSGNEWVLIKQLKES